MGVSLYAFIRKQQYLHYKLAAFAMLSNVVKLTPLRLCPFYAY